MTDTEKRIVALIVEHAKLPPNSIVSATMPLFDGGLGLDSIDALEIIMAVEKEFDLAIPEDSEVLRSVSTIAAFVDAAEEKENAR